MGKDHDGMLMGGALSFMLRRVQVFVRIVALLAVAACGSVHGGAALQSDPPRVDAGGRWGSTWVVEELRIGVAAEPQELVFDHMAFIAVDGDGTLFVVDGSGPGPWRLRSYSAGGSFLQYLEVGDVQAAEERRILGLKVLSDGRLAVYRSANDAARRLEFFAGEG